MDSNGNVYREESVPQRPVSEADRARLDGFLRGLADEGERQRTIEVIDAKEAEIERLKGLIDHGGD